MKICSFFFSLLFSSSLLAQQSQKVDIAVSDSASAATIANASIKIAERLIAVDADGYVSLRLKPGDYQLVISSVGYRTKTVALSIVEGTKTKLKIQLVANDVMLTDVTIVGLSKEDAEAKNIKRSEMPVTIISGKDIINRASNLNEILARQAGVQIRMSGGIGSDCRISVRGLEGRRVQIFIDGSPLNTPDGTLGINDLPLQIIERIEIYKGTVPAWLGGDVKCGFLRIKSGQYVFDPTYFFNVANYNITGIPGNKIDYLQHMRYTAGGIVYSTGNIYALASNPPNYITDRPYGSFKVDIVNKIITKLALPYSNGYSATVAQYEGKLLWGLAMATGVGLYSYDPLTNTASANPVVTTQGDPSAIHVFQ